MICCSKKLKAKNINHDYSSHSFKGVFIKAKKYKCVNCNQEYLDLGLDHKINKEICNFILNQGCIHRNQLSYISKSLFNNSLIEFSHAVKSTPNHLISLINHKAILDVALQNRIAEAILRHFNKVTVSKAN